MKRLFPFICVFSCLVAADSFGGSATWNSTPTSSDWNTAENWIPNTVPGSSTDVATFATSTITQVSLTGRNNYLASILFNPGANSFSITVSGGNAYFSFQADGIVNNSGTTQQFNMLLAGQISFYNSSSCGNGTSFSVLGGFVNFNDMATAATAHFTVSDNSGVGGRVLFLGGTAANATFDIGRNGSVEMYNYASAENAAFNVTGGTLAINRTAYVGGSVIDCSEGGTVIFDTYKNLFVGSPLVTVHGAVSSSGLPGQITQNGPADHATIVVEGGTAPGASGAVMNVLGKSDLQYAQVTVTGGTSGGAGGTINFRGGCDGGTASVIMSDNAVFDMRNHNSDPLTIGSIAEQGSILLGSNQLQVGSNNLNATFAGVIEEGSSLEAAGSLNKIGTGTLTLTGANTYIGGTTVTSGNLTISNTTGSGTGMGNVTVQAGTLAGKGIIAGATTIGTGSGPGSFLQPGKGASTPTTLTLQDTLTLKSDCTYTWKLNTNKAKADQLIANGVTIESGAQFNFKTVANKKLATRTIFTAISNTSASSISGTFANLADGSTVALGANKLQASYSGGDGNDLTLTVVP